MVVLKYNGILKSFRHWVILRASPPLCGIISYTPSTCEPSQTRRRAIISPISPEPKITTLSPTFFPSMLMSFCAQPAEKIPAGREPQRLIAPAGFSLHPRASTTERANTSTSPSPLNADTKKPSFSRSIE